MRRRKANDERQAEVHQERESKRLEAVRKPEEVMSAAMDCLEGESSYLTAVLEPGSLLSAAGLTDITVDGLRSSM